MTNARNRAGEGRFLAAMQHDDHQQGPTRRKPNGRAGWIAFALGDAPLDEVQLINRSEAIDDQGRRGRDD